MKVFTENCRIPIKSWCESPEEGAIKQAVNVASLPFAFKQLVLCLCQQAIFKVFKPRQQVSFDNFINIPHNYARYENHFGQNVVVHRKGATSARENELGLIPGSQGTKSYIVKGKGNKDSFESCSHGAGRKMGRKQAQKTLNLEAERESLDKLGVIHSVRNTDDLDEAPGSYKDIDVVIAEQLDLIDIVEKLSPLAVIKG